MSGWRPAGTAVDEMFPNRHEPAPGAGVESPSRAAGGFPTLGGGMRGRTHLDVAGRGAAFGPPGAAATSEGAAGTNEGEA
jgi:hypothetical protein